MLWKTSIVISNQKIFFSKEHDSILPTLALQHIDLQCLTISLPYMVRKFIWLQNKDEMKCIIALSTFSPLDVFFSNFLYSEKTFQSNFLKAFDDIMAQESVIFQLMSVSVTIYRQYRYSFRSIYAGKIRYY